MFVLFEAACVVDEERSTLNARTGSGYGGHYCCALMQTYAQDCAVKMSLS
jgi:hypothetical protein